MLKLLSDAAFLPRAEPGARASIGTAYLGPDAQEQVCGAGQSAAGKEGECFQGAPWLSPPRTTGVQSCWGLLRSHVEHASELSAHG